MIRGQRISLTRLKAFEQELRKIWGNDCKKARSRVLNVTPVIDAKPELTKKNESPIMVH